jgi:hypothetical protein
VEDGEAREEPDQKDCLHGTFAGVSEEKGASEEDDTGNPNTDIGVAEKFFSFFLIHCLRQ